MANSEVVKINLGDIGGPVFIGRPKGEAARRKYKLDEIDNTNSTVQVSIPKTVYSINSSFFLGFFGKSVRSAGSREAFKNKFTFDAPEDVAIEIDKYITKALHRYESILNNDGDNE